MEQNSFHESYEDYLKAIYKISKTHRGGYNLRECELIDWKPRGSVRLTPRGKKIAQHTLKNYQILYDFFIRFLKLKNKELVQDLSCKIEHHLPEEVSAALQGLLS